MITVILTVWRRNNLEEQIIALHKQTVLPTKIFIYHCRFNIDPDLDLPEKYPLIEYQVNTDDLGYFGRFSLALHAKTPYVYILDDDVIPSEDWLQRCMDLCISKNCIISATGRIIPTMDFTPERPKDIKQEYINRYFVGDNNSEFLENYCLSDTYVDFGCNSWFLKTDWLTYFWGVKPFTTTTGEDIHLSVSCLMFGGIRTLVPKQVNVNTSGNMKKYYGFDQFASWTKNDFISEREAIFKYWIENKGWTPILW